MWLTLQAVENEVSAPAAEVAQEFTLLSLLMVVLFGFLAVLFVVAFVLSLLRIARRRSSARCDRGSGAEGRSDAVDPWRESASRIALEEDAPREEGPDDDLPPLGGRFS